MCVTKYNNYKHPIWGIHLWVDLFLGHKLSSDAESVINKSKCAARLKCQCGYVKLMPLPLIVLFENYKRSELLWHDITRT